MPTTKRYKITETDNHRRDNCQQSRICNCSADHQKTDVFTYFRRFLRHFGLRQCDFLPNQSAGFGSEFGKQIADRTIFFDNLLLCHNKTPSFRIFLNAL